MLYNYLKIAVRKLWQHRLYSAINITGLMVGIGSALLLFSWVQSEVEMDRFHEKGDRLHRVLVNNLFDNEMMTWEHAPYLMVEELIESYPEVEGVTAIKQTSFAFELGEERSLEKGIYTDSSFFDMYSFELVAGTAKPIYNSRFRLAISETLGEKIFGHTDYHAMIGKTAKVWQNRTYEIVGVFANVPDNSSLQFDFVLDIEDHFFNNPNQLNWVVWNEKLTILLREGTDAATFNKKIATIIPLSNEQETEEERGYVVLQNYADHYLYGRYENGVLAGGRIDYIKLILFAAFLLIFVACINFINLTTARASRQAKEIGVRKVVGASRRTLVSQYLAEAFVTTIIATLLSVVVTEFSFNYFEGVTGRSLSFAYHLPPFWIIITGLILFTGLMSGAYPAFFLSGIGLQTALKSKTKLSSGGLRKFLVITQFTVSIVLILGALTVRQQINYVQTKNTGINRSHILSFEMYQRMYQNQEAFLDQVRKIPGVNSFSRLHTSPVNVQNKTTGLKVTSEAEANYTTFFSGLITDDQFTTMFGPKLIEGQPLINQENRDTTTYLVNEAMVKAFGWTNPVGKHIEVWGTSGTIVGVVENFHFKSLHHEINPLILINNPDETNFLYIETKPGQDAAVLAALEKVHKEFAPSFPFEYTFLDQEYDQLYANEKHTSMLASYFAIVTVFLSSLGLLGLISFLAEQKSKEIGIRKVLGASVTNIIQLLSKEFVQLILIALVIGIPLAWWLLQQWLDDFAYATAIDISTILIAIIVLCLVALLTVGYQSVRAATGNPVEVLRNE